MPKRKIMPLTNLKALRIRLGMSQNDFGDILGYKRNTQNQSEYRRIETGVVRITADGCYTVLHNFNISLKELLQK